IPEALSRGAQALVEKEWVDAPGVVQILVPDVREALARLAAAFYGDPSESMTLVGITGTNGKTTTSYLLESIVQEGGGKAGVIGTVNYRFADQVLPATTTTPESLDLQRNLAAMRQAGVTHAVLEVSSHALVMNRVRNCDFDVALFTNLTRDHLDYHGTLENYFQAKQLLFTQGLRESRKKEHFAVINLDDPKGQELSRMACGVLLGYGLENHRDVWPEKVEESADGQRARVVTPRGPLAVVSSLIGQHNLYNIMAAVTAAEALQLSPVAIASGIEKLKRVPGRLEPVPGKKGIRAFVDYAHTPDALERALRALQRIQPRRLVVVFGCGGDRDRGKRPLMGRVAGLESDLAIITSDNPRSEDPLEIIAEVEKGMAGTNRQKLALRDLSSGNGSVDPAVSGYLVIPDRREAIRLAIRVAVPGDILLIAGKGHEDYQILGGKKIHFDDREEAAAALNE
ncbi:MAG: UDP-N-acetylmuramoyl-L-alanyl-D-glutamate--2,6-diaminopimelate ligase, partial [Deltaproteobacteria bacterium]|nr:UDP-N-acetylmuramoyl-L-alanyl-D-glutamate--2,6-diaminopimelate ligase [Deltaproteobacteria bacterium]